MIVDYSATIGLFYFKAFATYDDIFRREEQIFFMCNKLIQIFPNSLQKQNSFNFPRFLFIFIFNKKYIQLYLLMPEVTGFISNKNEVRYIFPRDSRHLLTVSSKNQLYNNMILHFREIQFPNIDYPYIVKTWESNKKIVAQCKYCKNVLRYKKDKNDLYTLYGYSIEHVHVKEGDRQKGQYQGIITIYAQIQDFNDKVAEKIRSFEKNTLNHRKETFDGKLPNTFQQLLELIQKEDCFSYYYPKDFEEENLSFPDTMMIITPQMKYMYLKYGKCIGFDFTFSLIKDRPIPIQGRKPQYMIGMIAGLNSNRRLTLYAFIISNKEDGLTVYNIFSNFLKFMGKEPETIVTDQAFGMLAGLRRLKKNGEFHGQAYWDTFHVLKNYKFRNVDLKKKMQTMIREKSKIKFQQMYLEAVNLAKTEEELDAVHKYVFQSKKYCISQVKEKLFFGLCVSDSHNQMVNNLIKNIIPHQCPYPHVAARILRFTSERNNLNDTVVREMCRVQNVFNIQKLKLLRFSFSFKIFRSLFTQLTRSTSCQIIYIHQNLYIIEALDSIYFVSQADEADIQTKKKLRYSCSCQYQGKTGIPCCHILKVLYKNNQNDLLSQVDPYYVIENPTQLKECIFDTKCRQQFIKPGNRRGRPTVFIRADAEQKLPPGVIRIEKFRKKSDLQKEREKDRQNMQIYKEESEFKQIGSNLIEEEDDQKVIKSEKPAGYRWQKMKDYFLKDQ